MANYMGYEIEEMLKDLGAITELDQGIWRPSFSQADNLAKDLIRGWMEDSGMNCFEDEMGNLFGRIEGRTKETILIGSHRDTVKDGGLYDGAAGIALGIVALRELMKNQTSLQKSIEVVALVEEEASRFPSGYLGSKAITGTITDVELDDVDDQGNILREVLKSQGYSSERLETYKREDIVAFLEVHVEQGRILQDKQMDIGIVENIVGLFAYDITIHGLQDHAGTTPMDIRKDALYVASTFIKDMIDRTTLSFENTTFTVGRLNVLPGMSNVVPKEVNFTVDLRSDTLTNILTLEKEMLAMLESYSTKGFEFKFTRTCDEVPIALDNVLGKAIEKAVEACDLKGLRMNSGAGHDSQIMALEYPTGLFFVPSKDGKSHSSEEYTKAEDLNKGASVLMETIKLILEDI